MQRNNIRNLEDSTEVNSIRRGVSSDWVVTTDKASGPVPNPVVLFCDHTNEYEVVGIKQQDDSDVVQVNEA